MNYTMRDLFFMCLVCLFPQICVGETHLILRMVEQGASIEVLQKLAHESHKTINDYYPYHIYEDFHDKRTPLFVAVASGNVEMAQYLLETGVVSVDHGIKNGISPLGHLISLAGRDVQRRNELSGVLLLRGANIFEVSDKLGASLAHVAIACDSDDEVTKQFLKHHDINHIIKQEGIQILLDLLANNQLLEQAGVDNFLERMASVFLLLKHNEIHDWKTNSEIFSRVSKWNDEDARMKALKLLKAEGFTAFDLASAEGAVSVESISLDLGEG